MPEPRCPVHHTDMLPATHWIKSEGKPFPKPIHVCGREGCLYAYDANGYHEISETEPIGNSIREIIGKQSGILGRKAQH